MEQLEELLKQVEDISKGITTEGNKRRVSGEMFNIFEILRIGHYEAYTHSPILTELLNPQGMHGCEDLFLKSFLKVLGKEDFFYNTKEVSVVLEKFIGRIDADYEEGGQIDLLIHEKQEAAIIIENKIYAKDQRKQLYRYCRYAQSKYKKYIILYLTLDAHEPEKDSIEGNDSWIEVKPICISYRHHIREWINDCIEKVKNKVNLQSSLKQYLYTINKLTNQDMDGVSKEELIKLLSKPENINQALLIRNTADEALDKFMHDQFERQLKDISNDLNLELNIYVEHWYDTYAGFVFQRKEWKDFSIGFEFSSALRGFSYGFKLQKIENYDAVESKRKDLIKSFGGKASQPWWACWKYFPEKDWNNEEVVEMISTGEMKEKIKGAINECLSLVKGMEL